MKSGPPQVPWVLGQMEIFSLCAWTCETRESVLNLPLKIPLICGASPKRVLCKRTLRGPLLKFVFFQSGYAVRIIYISANNQLTLDVGVYCPVVWALATQAKNHGLCGFQAFTSSQLSCNTKQCNVRFLNALMLNLVHLTLSDFWVLESLLTRVNVWDSRGKYCSWSLAVEGFKFTKPVSCVCGGRSLAST